MSTVLIIVGSVVAFAGLMVMLLMIGSKEVKNLSINEVDLGKIADGTYSGMYKKSRWNYDVTVEVKGHKIISVINNNKSMEKMMGDLNKKITDSMLEKQSIVIDAVSGATINTRAFQKAVENALTDGSSS